MKCPNCDFDRGLDQYSLVGPIGMRDIPLNVWRCPDCTFCGSALDINSQLEVIDVPSPAEVREILNEQRTITLEDVLSPDISKKLTITKEVEQLNLLIDKPDA